MKVRHKGVDLKFLQGKVLICVTRITKGSGSIKLTRLSKLCGYSKLENDCEAERQVCFDLLMAFKTCH